MVAASAGSAVIESEGVEYYFPATLPCAVTVGSRVSFEAIAAERVLPGRRPTAFRPVSI